MRSGFYGSDRTTRYFCTIARDVGSVVIVQDGEYVFGQHAGLGAFIIRYDSVIMISPRLAVFVDDLGL